MSRPRLLHLSSMVYHLTLHCLIHMLCFMPRLCQAYIKLLALNLVSSTDVFLRILLTDNFPVAHFVQNVVALYERHFDTLAKDALENLDVEGKECSNLIVLLSELYNFQVISSVLVFDVIRTLLSDELSEFKVELLLKIVRSMAFHFAPTWYILTFYPDSGQQLRQDDPSALKDIIQIVQNKVSDKNEALRYT